MVSGRPAGRPERASSRVAVDLVGGAFRRERLAQRDVEVHRPGCRSLGLGHGAAAGRAEVQQPVVVGVDVAQLAEPANGRAVQLDLIDRLAGAAVAQLRRPVGGDHDQRHARLARPRRPPGERSRRPSRRSSRTAAGRPVCCADAEREEAGAALVDDAPDLDPLARSRRPAPAAPTASPGQTQACSTPARASSSTSAEQSAVLRLVASIGRRASLRRWPAGRSRPRRARRRGRARRSGQQRVASSARRAIAGHSENRRCVARPWANRRRRQRQREVGGGGDPDRAVERAGEIGWAAISAIVAGRGDAADLRELDRGRVAGLAARIARVASAAEATLSSATIGIEVAALTCGQLLERRRRAARPARCRSARARSGTSFAPPVVQEPLASIRRRASAPSASRTALTAADVVGSADLELEGRRSRARPSARRRRRPASGSPATSVALQRTAGVRSAPSSDQTGRSAACAARSSSAMSIAASAGAQTLEHAAAAEQRVASGSAPSSSSRQRSRSATTCAERRAAAQRQRHRLAEALLAARRRAAAPARSRAARAGRAPSRRACANGSA